VRQRRRIAGAVAHQDQPGIGERSSHGAMDATGVSAGAARTEEDGQACRRAPLPGGLEVAGQSDTSALGMMNQAIRPCARILVIVVVAQTCRLGVEK
jgi:hypothetical protein